MDNLRVWFGGTDTTIPDFTTPVGGTRPNLETPSFQASTTSYLSSWVPSLGGNSDISASQDNDCLPQLSWTQRMMVFVVLLLVGIFFCALSTMVIVSPRAFGKYYTIGNLFIIGSTFFLVGPKKQLLNLFDKSRFTAALVYFGSMAGTLYAAVYVQSVLLTLLLVIVQLAASIWYGSSYIPFAQSIIKSTASTILPL